VKGPFGNIYMNPKILDIEKISEQEKNDKMFNQSSDRINLDESN